MPTYVFDSLYNGTKRPTDYGSVSIEYEIINPGSVAQLFRPVLASGYICPPGTTSGRKKNVPEPASGFRIGQTKRIPKAALALSLRNTGRTDMDKGHIFALELGGPDVKENICPQFSQFQRNGEWRRMEVEALEFAEENDDALVFMTIAIIYGNAKSMSRALTPAGFLIDLARHEGQQKTPLKSYKIYNMQDETDDMMMARKDPDNPQQKDPAKFAVLYGESSSPTAFDRPAIGVQINGRPEIQKALSRRSSLSSGVQLLAQANDPNAMDISD